MSRKGLAFGFCHLPPPRPLNFKAEVLIFGLKLLGRIFRLGLFSLKYPVLCPPNCHLQGIVQIMSEASDTVDVPDARSAVEETAQWEPSMEDFNRTYAESVVNANGEENMLERLATLSDKISHMSATDMDTFQFDTGDFDLRRILEYVARSNEKNGVGRNNIDLCYQDLNVIGKNMSASIIKDVGDVLLPFIIKPYERLTHKKRLDLSKLSKTRKIIKDVTGIAEPGTMTLVLGRPGAGCSTLLKALSGDVRTYIGYEGDLTYSGVDSTEIFKDHKHMLVYNPELDIHLPYMTVEETLKFAIALKTPTVRVNNQTRTQYIENMKNLYEILFGLKHVEKTLVGNDFVRGISGGQRKRVSIAEAMVTGGSVYCFDNATRGLDASTALEFAEALRTSTNVTRCTSIVTIYQAAENIYKLFDYVTVLYSGRQIYFGPIDEAVDFFVRMGYVKAERQTSAEFLTSVTDPMARVVKAGVAGVPETADEFAAYWKNSEEYQKLLETIDAKRAKFSSQKTAEELKINHNTIKQKGTSANSQYTVNYWEQLKWCSWRRTMNIKNNMAYAVTQVVAATIQSLVIGSLTYNITPETIGAFTRGGVVFFSVLYFAILTLAETPVWFADKPILNKQYIYTMYHPSAEYLAKQVTGFPVRLIAVTFFSLILYFLSNLERDAGKFFQYYLLVVLSSQTVGALFTLLSAFAPNLQIAMGVSGVTLMMTLLYSSYMIQEPSMYWWFRWFSYVNSVKYVFEAIITMQFHGMVMPCSQVELIPFGPGYENINSIENQVCGFVGAAPSKELYDGRNDVSGSIYLELAFDYVFSHVWRNLGIVFGFLVGYTVITCVVVEFLNPIAASSDQLLFVKNATLSKAIMDEINPEAIDSADESISDLEKGTADEERNAVVEVSEIDASRTPDKLGSDDIFLWRNVNYVVPYQGEERKLLDNIQGYVLPGTLTALMGESGAGKTTLLNVLSKRTEVGVVTGDMLINGVPADASFERRTGYVQQQDLHIAELTVRESLLFSARMRRPQSVPDEEKVAYCETVMRILHMEDYADSVAGVPGYGLNVEQRKKLSIATELVAKPSLLLFLDEPTSGLDSQSSWAIVQVLKELAAAGQAILCTIHQPSATLFEEFDRLLLLRKGGQTVYFGDIGQNSRTMLDYFEKQGARVCSDDENPAEYVLEVIGAGATASVSADWNSLWKESAEAAEVSAKVAELVELSSKKEHSVDSDLQSTFATSYQYQMYYVLKRTATQFWRSVPYIMPRLGFMVIGGLVVGFTFWNVKHTVIGMQNAMFACFMTLVISAPLSNQIQGYAIKSRELFEVRESKSNTFHWSCLLFSQYLCEVPFSIVFSTFYFIAWYFPIQFDTEASRAGTWWLTYCVFFQLFYPSFALMILYPAPDLETANILLGLTFSFIVSFCGVVQRPTLMPGFWKFMWRVSPLTYFIGSELGIILHDRPVVCSQEEYNYLNPPQGQTCGEFLKTYFESSTGYVNNPDDTTNCAVCQYRVGDEFLHSLDISWDQRWRNIGFFCVYIGFNLFLMCALFYIFRIKKVNPAAGVKKLFARFGKGPKN